MKRQRERGGGGERERGGGGREGLKGSAHFALQILVVTIRYGAPYHDIREATQRVVNWDRRDSDQRVEWCSVVRIPILIWFDPPSSSPLRPTRSSCTRTHAEETIDGGRLSSFPPGLLWMSGFLARGIPVSWTSSCWCFASGNPWVPRRMPPGLKQQSSPTPPKFGWVSHFAFRKATSQFPTKSLGICTSMGSRECWDVEAGRMECCSNPFSILRKGRGKSTFTEAYSAMTITLKESEIALRAFAPSFPGSRVSTSWRAARVGMSTCAWKTLSRRSAARTSWTWKWESVAGMTMRTKKRFAQSGKSIRRRKELATGLLACVFTTQQRTLSSITTSSTDADWTRRPFRQACGSFSLTRQVSGTTLCWRCCGASRPLCAWFEEQRCLRFFASSLLVLYESAADTHDTYCQVDVRMIDFAHTYWSSPEEEGCVDENYLCGLRNLISALGQLRTSVATSNGLWQDFSDLEHTILFTNGKRAKLQRKCSLTDSWCLVDTRRSTNTHARAHTHARTHARAHRCTRTHPLHTPDNLSFAWPTLAQWIAAVQCAYNNPMKTSFLFFFFYNSNYEPAGFIVLGAFLSFSMSFNFFCLVLNRFIVDYLPLDMVHQYKPRRRNVTTIALVTVLSVAVLFKVWFHAFFFFVILLGPGNWILERFHAGHIMNKIRRRLLLRGAWRDHCFPEPFSWFLHETGLESLKITSARCFLLKCQRKDSKKAKEHRQFRGVLGRWRTAPIDRTTFPCLSAV